MTDNKMLGSDEGVKLGLSYSQVLGTILGNVFGITFGVVFGTELGSLDGSFDYSKYGKLEVFLETQ